MVVEAPAIVFDEQDDVKAAFDRGELNCDFVAVVRFQGPRARGMPELHKLTPTLSLLQDRGHRVALVTDGRMVLPGLVVCGPCRAKTHDACPSP